MKKIKITLHKDGTQKVEVLDCTGEACVSFTAALEKRLGDPVGERGLKPDYELSEAESEPERERDR